MLRIQTAFIVAFRTTGAHRCKGDLLGSRGRPAMKAPEAHCPRLAAADLSDLFGGVHCNSEAALGSGADCPSAVGSPTVLLRISCFYLVQGRMQDDRTEPRCRKQPCPFSGTSCCFLSQRGVRHVEDKNGNG